MGLTKHKLVEFSNYKKEQTPKNQIYLHHTAGGPSGEAVFRGWQKDPTPVCTSVAISRDGTIVQGFSSKYWGYHLGLATKHFAKMNLPYKNLDRGSIGIEICNFGMLTEKDGKFYTYVKSEIPASDVRVLDTPYKGYKYWQKYTPEQIESTIELLQLWKERYGIPISYNSDIWDLTPRALKGEAGVYTHNSVRADKADVYPCPNLIKALESL